MIVCGTQMAARMIDYPGNVNCRRGVAEGGSGYNVEASFPRRVALSISISTTATVYICEHIV